MLHLIIQNVRRARDHLQAARDNDLTSYMCEVDIMQIPPALSARPGLDAQGGMHRFRQVVAPHQTAPVRACVAHLDCLINAFIQLAQDAVVPSGHHPESVIHQTSEQAILTHLESLALPDRPNLQQLLGRLLTIAIRRMQQFVYPTQAAAVPSDAYSRVAHLYQCWKPLLMMRLAIDNLYIEKYMDYLEAGGEPTCSPTVAFRTPEEETTFETYLPHHLREHRLLVLTPTGSQHFLWRHDDEIAWFLLLAGYHPFYYVLTAYAQNWEVTLAMDTLMQHIPTAYYAIQLRANFWESPLTLPRMFGGGPEDADSAAFAQQLRTIMPWFPGVKKEKIKLLLRGAPGLRNKVAKNIADREKVVKLIEEHAQRYSMDIIPAGKPPSALKRSKSAGPPPRQPRGTAKPTEAKSHGEAASSHERKVAFKREMPKPAVADLKLSLTNEWSVPPREEFSAEEPGIYMAESFQQISTWASQTRNSDTAIAILCPYAHQIPGMPPARSVVANLVERKGTSERNVMVKAWLIGISKTEVKLQHETAELIFEAPVKKSMVTSVDVDLRHA